MPPSKNQRSRRSEQVFTENEEILTGRPNNSAIPHKSSRRRRSPRNPSPSLLDTELTEPQPRQSNQMEERECAETGSNITESSQNEPDIADPGRGRRIYRPLAPVTRAEFTPSETDSDVCSVEVSPSGGVSRAETLASGYTGVTETMNFCIRFGRFEVSRSKSRGPGVRRKGVGHGAVPGTLRHRKSQYWRRNRPFIPECDPYWEERFKELKELAPYGFLFMSWKEYCREAISTRHEPQPNVWYGNQFRRVRNYFDFLHRMYSRHRYPGV